MQQTVQSHGVFRFLIWFRGCSRCCDAYVGDHVCPRLRRMIMQERNRTQPKLCCSIGGIRTGIMESDQGRATEAFSFAKNYKLNFSSLVGPRGPPRNPGLIWPFRKGWCRRKTGKTGASEYVSVCLSGTIWSPSNFLAFSYFLIILDSNPSLF